MKLLFEIMQSPQDSNGNIEFAIVVRGQFPITSYSKACVLQDGLALVTDRAIKKTARTRKSLVEVRR